jgi:hypothetical protein
MDNSQRRFALSLLPGSFAIVRLAANAGLPAWATRSAFFSVTRTDEELSIVCAAEHVPDGIAVQGGWRILKVQGPFALSEIGVLASLAAPIAGAKVSLFVISTFDTDYLLVSEEQLEAAKAALKSAGHLVREESF